MSEQVTFSPSKMPQRRIEHPVIPPTLVEAPAPASQPEGPQQPVELPRPVVSAKVLERSIRSALGGGHQGFIHGRPQPRRGYKSTGKLQDMSVPIQEA